MSISLHLWPVSPLLTGTHGSSHDLAALGLNCPFNLKSNIKRGALSWQLLRKISETGLIGQRGSRAHEPITVMRKMYSDWPAWVTCLSWNQGMGGISARTSQTKNGAGQMSPLWTSRMPPTFLLPAFCLSSHASPIPAHWGSGVAG